ncbi:MAG: diguanylate cyclase [Burkholderiaceae bacterium]|nr:diguanylate cyclase [Burkholderiaceae bacterium]
MPTIAWDDKLATGLADVDAQHKQLFDIINHFGAIYASGTSSSQLAAALQKLKKRLAVHFDHESELMQRHAINPTHRELHMRAHDSFAQQLDRTSYLVANNPDTTVTLLLDFLAEWMVHHIANMDRLMASEIRAMQAGLPPEQVILCQELVKEDLVENISALYRDLGEHTFRILELNLQLQSEIARRGKIEQELSESKARFRTVADHTHSWEYWEGPNGEIIYMSPSCERITGYSAEEFSANPDLLYDIIHPEDRQLMEEHRQNIVYEEQDEDERGFRIVRRDGDIRWIIHGCKTLYDADGVFLGRRGSNRDITDRRSQNDSMLLLTSVFDAVNEAALLTDEDNRIVAVNTSFTDITGYSSEEVIGQHPGVLKETMPAAEFTHELWRTMTSSGRWQGEVPLRHKNGEIYTASVSLDTVRDDQGHTSNFVLVFSDISERKENEQRLYFLAHYDQVTGLPNWALFNDRLQQALSGAKLRNEPMALMFVDIDRFKSVKDKLGHETSDLLIREMAQRLQACLHEPDTAARIGSDEFVILLPSITTAYQASRMAEKILQLVAQPFVLGTQNVSITTSIGIALYPDHCTDADQLMRNADLAMYQAKRAGGAVAMIYNNPDDWLSKIRSEEAPQ